MSLMTNIAMGLLKQSLNGLKKEYEKMQKLPVEEKAKIDADDLQQFSHRIEIIQLKYSNISNPTESDLINLRNDFSELVEYMHDHFDT